MAKNKYEKLMSKKKGLYTSDNRPIETYRKGKEKISIAFSPNGEMEIISHNPIPFLSALSLGSRAVGAVGAVKSIFNKKENKAEVTKEAKEQRRKSLAREIIEAELYEDKQF